MADEIDERGLPVWPAAERNKDHILKELLQVLPKAGGVLLEIASATGQHAEHFAAALPHYKLQPTDYDDSHLDALQRRKRAINIDNFLPPLRLDVMDIEWPLSQADIIYNANMVHIAPWEVAEALFRGAGQVLSPGGLLITYGPYLLDGSHTSESNEQFDASLRKRDERWGIRDLADLRSIGAAAGLIARKPTAMPANNFLVVWDKQGS